MAQLDGLFILQFAIASYPFERKCEIELRIPSQARRIKQRVQGVEFHGLIFFFFFSFFFA